MEFPPGQDGGAVSGAVPDALGFAAAGAQAMRVKCMGRTYAVTGTTDQLVLSDVTDVTRPLLLGTAVPAGALWDVHAPDGRALLRTGDLLPALVALRADYTSSTKVTSVRRPPAAPPAARRTPSLGPAARWAPASSPEAAPTVSAASRPAR
ncbi:hypothetical protein [Kitasatospora kifunensis]